MKLTLLRGADIFVLELDENDDVVATGKATYTDNAISYTKQDTTGKAKAFLMDFYVEKAANATQVEITPDTFAAASLAASIAASTAAT